MLPSVSASDLTTVDDDGERPHEYEIKIVAMATLLDDGRALIDEINDAMGGNRLHGAGYALEKRLTAERLDKELRPSVIGEPLQHGF